MVAMGVLGSASTRSSEASRFDRRGTVSSPDGMESPSKGMTGDGIKGDVHCDHPIASPGLLSKAIHSNM